MMKQIILSLLMILSLIKISVAQDTSKYKHFYNKEFNWTMPIPSGFDTVDAQYWAKIKNRGTEAVEKTYNQKVKDETTTILALISGKGNYFEAISQPFNAKSDSDYQRLNKNVNDIIYHTLATQIPGAKLDSATTKSIIGTLSFDAFILKSTLPNGIIFSIYSFSRLFGKKQLAVNIIFIDTTKGDQMLNSWKSSTFGK